MNESKLLNEGKSRQSLPFHFSILISILCLPKMKNWRHQEKTNTKISENTFKFTLQFNFFPLKYKFLLSYSIYDYRCMKR